MCWDDIEIPWLDNDNFADLILDKVCWTDILDECSVSYRENGHDSYKVQCPFHASGNERTPSLSATEANGTYYCFACAASGSKIEFVSKLFGIPYHKAMEWLATLAEIDGVNIDMLDLPARRHRPPEETVAHYVHKSGILLRDTLISFTGSSEYGKWSRWVDKQFVKLDVCLDQGDDSWEIAKAYLEWLGNKISERLNK